MKSIKRNKVVEVNRKEFNIAVILFAEQERRINGKKFHHIEVTSINDQSYDESYKIDSTSNLEYELDKIEHKITTDLNKHLDMSKSEEEIFLEQHGYM